jgi:hypothetical protein
LAAFGLILKKRNARDEDDAPPIEAAEPTAADIGQFLKSAGIFPPTTALVSSFADSELEKFRSYKSPFSPPHVRTPFPSVVVHYLPSFTNGW